MSALSAAELTSMRTELNVTLPEVAVVKRRALTSDGGGGSTEVWSTLVTTTGRLSPDQRRGHEDERASEILSVQVWLITLPAATDITAKDRVVIGGRTFSVLEDDGTRSFEIARRVRCEEVT